MCEDAKDISRHTTCAQNVEKLHRLHFKTVVAVDHQQTYIDNLCDVDHAGKGVGGTFYKGEASALGGDDCERAGRRRKRLLGVSSDQALDESCFSDTRGANDTDDDWGRFFGDAVDERYVEALLFDLRLSVLVAQRTEHVAYF